MNKFHLRITSFITLSTFLFTQACFSPQALAAASTVFAPEADIPTTFQLDLSPDLGKIETLIPGGEATIIHIQEPHGSYEAQKKIEAILRELKNKYGADLILLEGTAFKLHPELAQLVPDKTKNREILEQLAKEGWVSGPELFLADEKNAEGYGIEDVESYRQNYKAFVEVLTQKEKTSGFLKSLDEQIERFKAAFLGRDLKQFLTRLEGFENKIVGFEEWLNYLKGEAKQALGLDLADPMNQFDWPMLARVYTIRRFEKEMDAEKLEQEKRQFLEDVKISVHRRRSIVHSKTQGNRIEVSRDGLWSMDYGLYAQIDHILSSPLSQNSFAAGEIEKLFEELVSHLPKDFNYSAYPNLNRFIGRLILQSEIDGGRLFDELHRLSDQISQKFATTGEEKKLIELLKDYRLLKRLFALELSPEDYEKIQNPKSKIRSKSQILNSNLEFVSDFEFSASDLLPSSIASRFLAINSDKRIRDISFQHLSEIDGLFAKALAFYRWVKLRDERMLANVEKYLKETGKTKAVVITGGFHSDPFKEYFQSKGINYALISPKIGSLLRDSHQNYVKQMLENYQNAKASTLKGTARLLTPHRVQAQLGVNSKRFERRLANVRSELRNQETKAAASKSVVAKPREIIYEEVWRGTKVNIPMGYREQASHEQPSERRSPLDTRSNARSELRTEKEIRRLLVQLKPWTYYFERRAIQEAMQKFGKEETIDVLSAVVELTQRLNRNGVIHKMSIWDRWKNMLSLSHIEFLGIPVIARVAKTPEELKEYLNLATRLAEKGIDPSNTLRYGIPAIAEVAEPPEDEELKEYLNLATRLAEKGIDPSHTLRYGIPAIAGVAETPEELKGVLSELEALVSRLLEKGIDPNMAKVAKTPEERKEELSKLEALVSRLLEKGIDPLMAKKVGKTPEERKEVLSELEALVIRLFEKGVDFSATLRYGIPAIAEVAKTPEELKEVLSELEALVIRLTNDSNYNRFRISNTLRDDIPAIAKVAKTPEELKEYLNLATRLAEKGIDPSNTLRYGIPAIAKLAKTPEELKEVLSELEALVIRLTKDSSYINSFRISNTLRDDIPAIAKVAKTPAELKEYLNLATRLVEKGINPSDARYYIPAIAKLAKTPGELKEVLSELGAFVSRLRKMGIHHSNTLRDDISATAKDAKTPEMFKLHLRYLEVLGSALQSKAPIGAIIFSEVDYSTLIADAIKTQKKDGGFDIDFSPEISHDEFDDISLTTFIDQHQSIRIIPGKIKFPEPRIQSEVNKPEATQPSERRSPLDTRSNARSEVRNEAAVKAAMRDIRSLSYDTRKMAAETLGRLKAVEAVDELIAIVVDDNLFHGVRMSGVRALGLIGDERAVVPLSDLLQTTDGDDLNATATRMEVAIALAHIGGSAAILILRLMLSDWYPLAWKNALAGLVNRARDGDLEALQALMRAFSKDTVQDVAPETRAMIALELGKIGSKQAVPLLTDALNDGEEKVRNFARAALDSIQATQIQFDVPAGRSELRAVEIDVPIDGTYVREVTKDPEYLAATEPKGGTFQHRGYRVFLIDWLAGSDDTPNETLAGHQVRLIRALRQGIIVPRGEEATLAADLFNGIARARRTLFWISPDGNLSAFREDVATPFKPQSNAGFVIDEAFRNAESFVLSPLENVYQVAKLQTQKFPVQISDTQIHFTIPQRSEVRHTASEQTSGLKVALSEIEPLTTAWGEDIPKSFTLQIGSDPKALDTYRFSLSEQTAEELQTTKKDEQLLTYNIALVLGDRLIPLNEASLNIKVVNNSDKGPFAVQHGYGKLGRESWVNFHWTREGLIWPIQNWLDRQERWTINNLRSELRTDEAPETEEGELLATGEEAWEGLQRMADQLVAPELTYIPDAVTLNHPAARNGQLSSSRVSLRSELRTAKRDLLLAEFESRYRLFQELSQEIAEINPNDQDWLDRMDSILSSAEKAWAAANVTASNNAITRAIKAINQLIGELKEIELTQSIFNMTSVYVVDTVNPGLGVTLRQPPITPSAFSRSELRSDYTPVAEFFKADHDRIRDKLLRELRAILGAANVHGTLLARQGLNAETVEEWRAAGDLVNLISVMMDEIEQKQIEFRLQADGRLPAQTIEFLRRLWPVPEKAGLFKTAVDKTKLFIDFDRQFPTLKGFLDAIAASSSHQETSNIEPKRIREGSDTKFFFKVPTPKPPQLSHVAIAPTDTQDARSELRSNSNNLSTASATTSKSSSELRTLEDEILAVNNRMKDALNTSAELSKEKWIQQSGEVMALIQKFIATGTAIFERASEDRRALLLQVIVGIQSAIAFPQLFSSDVDGAVPTRNALTELWTKVGHELETGRVKKIQEVVKASLSAPTEDSLKKSHIGFDELGNEVLEDLPPDVWSKYGNEIWAPHLNRAYLQKLIRSMKDFSVDPTTRQMKIPARYGKFENLSKVPAQLGVTEPNPVDRLTKYVEIENKAYGNPTLALELAKDKLNLGGFNTIQDYRNFTDEFAFVMRLLKSYENWESKKTLLEDNGFKQRLERIQSLLSLPNSEISLEDLALRLLSLNIPLGLVERAANNEVIPGDQFEKSGEEFVRSGRVQEVLMAGGKAARWRSSLDELVHLGMKIDKEEIPDGPRALAAYWIGGAKSGGLTGNDLALDHLDKLLLEGYQAKAAYILSPETWQDFMTVYWKKFDANAPRRPDLTIIAQNPGPGVEIKNGILTETLISDRVLGHGNVTGWVSGIIDSLKQGIVFQILHSADNPLARLNSKQFKEAVGRMRRETIVHIGFGNVRNIGQKGGGYVAVNGISDIVDSAIPKTENRDRFLADRDIEVFNALQNVINLPAVLYAIGWKGISWDEVVAITRLESNEDEAVFTRLKQDLNQLTPQELEALSSNFSKLMPSEFVTKTEGDKKLVQWEQISSMLHGGLVKAIKKRFDTERINWDVRKLALAYLDISLFEYSLLKESPDQLRTPTFAEVKQTADLFKVMRPVQELIRKMSEQGFFTENVQKVLDNQPRSELRFDVGEKEWQMPKLAHAFELDQPVHWRDANGNFEFHLRHIPTVLQGRRIQIHFVLPETNAEEVKASEEIAWHQITPDVQSIHVNAEARKFFREHPGVNITHYVLLLDWPLTPAEREALHHARIPLFRKRSEIRNVENLMNQFLRPSAKLVRTIYGAAILPVEVIGKVSRTVGRQIVGALTGRTVNSEGIEIGVDITTIDQILGQFPTLRNLIESLPKEGPAQLVDHRSARNPAELALALAPALILAAKRSELRYTLLLEGTPEEVSEFNRHLAAVGKKLDVNLFTLSNFIVQIVNASDLPKAVGRNLTDANTPAAVLTPRAGKAIGVRKNRVRVEITKPDLQSETLLLIAQRLDELTVLYLQILQDKDLFNSELATRISAEIKRLKALLTAA